MTLSLGRVIILSLLVGVSQASGDPRPKLGTASSERVNYEDFGISLFVPEGTVLIGARPSGEAFNYRWPWLETMHGHIDVACETDPKGADLKEMALAHLVNSRTKWKITDTETMEINGIPMTRAAIHQETEGKLGGRPRPPYPIIRYYFLTGSKVLAFFHLHGWKDRADLEAVLKTAKRLPAGK